MVDSSKFNCKYTSTGKSRGTEKEYKCLRCEHTRWSRYPANMLHRRCNKPDGDVNELPEGHWFDPKKRIKEMMDEMVEKGANKQTPEQMEETLERCFSGCDQFDGVVCINRGSPCQHFGRWVERLLLNGCNYKSR